MVELRVGVRTDFLRGFDEELIGRTLREASDGLSFCLCLFFSEDEMVGFVRECTEGLYAAARAACRAEVERRGECAELRIF